MNMMVIAVFIFVTAIVLGPLLIIFGYLHFHRRSINKRELQDLRNNISEIKADIADIKEQIAEFIIKNN